MKTAIRFISLLDSIIGFRLKTGENGSLHSNTGYLKILPPCRMNAAGRLKAQGRNRCLPTDGNGRFAWPPASRL